ncbi:acyltransferase [Aquipseudomonas alcaligenes]|uniref:acyltransferase family protein n=1 Tax=Aquipseudomonas alcaligenes TaxID=43263 RepID=UPI0015C30482|nr:acyltransferase [Pseudomonas alcaligenes]
MDRRNLQIESLRAIAITFVLFSHLQIEVSGWYFNLPSHVELWAGVDLFFVISGFLITHSLLGLVGARERGTAWWPELKAFWIRRAFRLLPAAWLWLLVPLLLSLLIGQHALFAPTRTLLNDALAAVLQVANLYWAHCIGSGQWGELCSQPPVLSPYWSLSLEEQFYLLLPILLILLPARLLLPVLALLLITHLFWIRPILTLAWYVRPDSLLWGVVLALLSHRGIALGLGNSLKKLRLGMPLSLALLALLAWVPSLGAQVAPGVAMVGIVALIGAALVWLAATGNGIRPGAFLLWMSSRSYALYLVHAPVFFLAQFLLFPEGPRFLQGRYEIALYVICTFVAASLAAELTYRLVESPLRGYGRKLASRQLKQSSLMSATSTQS